MTPEEAKKKSKALFFGEVSESELAIRMAEASYGLRRPTGSTAAQALDAMEDESREGWCRAARAAMEYWQECIGNASQPS